MPKLRILDSGLVSTKTDGLKVKLVEGVEEIATQLEFGSLAKELQAGQTKLLGQTEIEAEVVGATEGIAADPRRTRSANVEIRRAL